MRRRRFYVLRCLWMLLPMSAGSCSSTKASDADDVDSLEFVSCEESAEFDLKAGTTWQWQRSRSIDVGFGVDVYVVDLFDTSEDTVNSLHADGRYVICVFSAGSFESGREDAALFPGSALGNPVDGSEDERWLDITSTDVRNIMSLRLDRAADLGCDGAAPDKVDGYFADTGFDFSDDDQAAFNRFIADGAHARGLSVGLKNDVFQAALLAPCFDWALNEECLVSDECGFYAPFIDADKAVFHVEYVDNINDGASLAAEVCDNPAVEGFSSLIKERSLSAWGIACE